MASQADIEQQQELLVTHRRTLAHLLHQAAAYGGETFAPPIVANGIYVARENIASIKATLSGWGVQVEDSSADAAGPTSQHIPALDAAQSWRKRPTRAWWGVLAAIFFLVVGLNQWRWLDRLPSTMPTASAQAILPTSLSAPNTPAQGPEPTVASPTPVPADILATAAAEPTCAGSSNAQATRVLVAEFKRTSDAPQSNQEDRLFDALQQQLPDQVEVCRVMHVVANQSDAQALSKQLNASVIIWGRIDASIYELHLEVAGWRWPNQPLPPQNTEQAKEFAFQMREITWVGFLARFSLSLVSYLQHHPQAARDMLVQALAEAPPPENPQTLAEAYFMLGLLYDTADAPDLPKAIDAYRQALQRDPNLHQALLNRGQAYADMADDVRARADFTTLITTESPLADVAYINRALLPSADRASAESDFASAIKLSPLVGYMQRGLTRLWIWRDPAEAVKDFEQALALDHTNPDIYHSLGQAQLLAQQGAAATRTYQAAVPYLTTQERDQIVEDLTSLVAHDADHLRSPVATIIANLRAAPLH